MQTGVHVLVLVACLLPVLVLSGPLDQPCQGRECNYFENLPDERGNEKEPEPDGVAVALFDQAKTFQDALDKINRMLGVLESAGEVSEESMNTLNFQRDEMEYMWKEKIMALLNSMYPFIENTRTSKYKNALNTARSLLGSLQKQYMNLKRKIESQARSAGVFDQLNPQHAGLKKLAEKKNRKKLARARQNDAWRNQQLRLLRKSFGRKKRSTDVSDDNLMEFTEQEDPDSSVY